MENKYIAQGIYVLECALSIVTGKRRKLRSCLNMQLGRAYRSLLDLAVQVDSKAHPVPEALNVQVLDLPMLVAKFRPLAFPTSVDSAKELFKTASNHFKTALEYFVIDGYVTEHIEMKKYISALYKGFATLINLMQESSPCWVEDWNF